MRHWLLLLIAAIVVAGIAYTVVWIFTGGDEGLAPTEPDGRAVPLPGNRPLAEGDVGAARFDTALRGYRMAQVDAAMRRTAYDIGYKQELIDVLEAEVDALRAGRRADADKLRAARMSALAGTDAAPAAGRHNAVAPEPPAEVEVVSDAFDEWDGGALDDESALAAADQTEGVEADGEETDQADADAGSAGAEDVDPHAGGAQREDSVEQATSGR